MATERVRVRGLNIYRPIIYGNTATVLTPKQREALAATAPDHTHTWTVAIRGAASGPDQDIVGGADDLSHFIKRVTFKLHDTYPNPSRNIDKPPYEVTETGWGEFEIQIRITFVPDAGEKPTTLYHHLKLHPWAAAGNPEIPPLDVAAKMGWCTRGSTTSSCSTTRSRRSSPRSPHTRRRRWYGTAASLCRSISRTRVATKRARAAHLYAADGEGGGGAAGGGAQGHRS